MSLSSVKTKYIPAVLIIVVTLGISLVAVFYTGGVKEFVIKNIYSVDSVRLAVSQYQKESIHKLIEDGRYRCCLSSPCSYCFLNSSSVGDSAVCDCLDEVVNGEHPCGECMGEILEGNGNKYLVEYFPEAIADEVGVNYLDSLRGIITDKYKIK